MKPRLLDLFSGAGGAGMGYHLAGFDVTGVDIKPQPRYPFAFIQSDALEYLAAHGHEYDAIHASPPCQAHTYLNKMWNARKHEDMIPATRDYLKATGRPYVIENVPGAKTLNATLMLCGTMFRLKTACGAELERHRYFEMEWWPLLVPVPPCDHGWASGVPVFGGKARDRRRTITVTGHTPQQNINQDLGIRRVFTTQDAKDALGCEWMGSMAELSQAIPPPYTKFIGEHLMQELNP